MAKAAVRAGVSFQRRPGNLDALLSAATLCLDDIPGDTQEPGGRMHDARVWRDLRRDRHEAPPSRVTLASPIHLPAVYRPNLTQAPATGL